MRFRCDQMAVWIFFVPLGESFHLPSVAGDFSRLFSCFGPIEFLFLYLKGFSVFLLPSAWASDCSFLLMNFALGGGRRVRARLFSFLGSFEEGGFQQWFEFFPDQDTSFFFSRLLCPPVGRAFHRSFLPEGSWPWGVAGPFLFKSRFGYSAPFLLFYFWRSSLLFFFFFLLTLLLMPCVCAGLVPLFCWV